MKEQRMWMNHCSCEGEWVSCTWCLADCSVQMSDWIRFVKTRTPTHAHTIFISLKALIKHFNRNTLFYAIHIHSVIWYIGRHFFCLAYMSICQSLLWQHLLYMTEKVNWNYRGHYTHANYELRKKKLNKHETCWRKLDEISLWARLTPIFISQRCSCHSKCLINE